MATATRRLNDSYMKLIAEFPLRRITWASEHSRAKQMVLRLSARKATCPSSHQRARNVGQRTGARLIAVPQSNLSKMFGGKRAWSKAAIRGVSQRLNIRPDRFFV